jgi:uncharacterized protein YjbJ (UPF0337 family)
MTKEKFAMTAHDHDGLRDRFLGKVKETAGSILRNDGLKEEGQLHRERAEAASQAEEADALAAQREAEAAVVSRQQELIAETERLRAEESRDAEADWVERSRIAGHVEIDAEARQKEIHLAHQEGEQEVAVEDALATAVSQRQMAEIRAVETERQADRARQVADALDDHAAGLPKDRS